jgi:hypothetical protein
MKILLAAIFCALFSLSASADTINGELILGTVSVGDFTYLDNYEGWTTGFNCPCLSSSPSPYRWNFAGLGINDCTISENAFISVKCCEPPAQTGQVWQVTSLSGSCVTLESCAAE